MSRVNNQQVMRTWAMKLGKRGLWFRKISETMQVSCSVVLYVRIGVCDVMWPHVGTLGQGYAANRGYARDIQMSISSTLLSLQCHLHNVTFYTGTTYYQSTQPKFQLKQQIHFIHPNTKAFVFHPTSYIHTYT